MLGYTTTTGVNTTYNTMGGYYVGIHQNGNSTVPNSFFTQLKYDLYWDMSPRLVTPAPAEHRCRYCDRIVREDVCAGCGAPR